jgi:hypothetical protein
MNKLKEMLTRKVFGGRVPVWVLMLIVGLAAYLWWRRKKAAGTTGAAAENPATSAGSDPSQPFGYSSPDMFPLSGGGGTLTSPTGAPTVDGSVGMTPTAPRVAPKVSTRANMLAYLRSRYPGRTKQFYTSEASKRLTIERAAVGNTPAYNTKITVPNTL